MPSTSSLALPISTGIDRKLAGHQRDTARRVAIATTLLTTGAHAGGPKTLRVFRIAMNTDDRP